MVNPEDPTSIGAIVGFNDGDLGIGRTLPGSRTDLVKNLTSTSNLLPPIKGVWMFQVDGLEVNSK